MKTTTRLMLTALFLVSLSGLSPAAERQLGHMVFFKLKESTPANKERLVEGCQKFLTGHEGTVYFSVGVLAEEMQRDVNDRNFDVALHLVFKDKAAHDAYAVHPRHMKFIEEFKEGWDNVRVFDSYLAPQRDPVRRPDREDARDRRPDREGAGQRRPDREGARDRRPERDQPARMALPDAATGFAGMIRAKVVAKRDAGVVVQVEEVLRPWEHNRAPNARVLVGKQVLVTPGEGPAGRFLSLVEVGALLELDVAHKRGETLTLLELTAEQRARVEKAK